MLTYQPPQMDSNMSEYTNPNCYYPTTIPYQPSQQISSSTIKLNLARSFQQRIDSCTLSPPINDNNNTNISNPILFNKYCPISLIGKGTFGDIYKVMDITNQKQYAMKMVKQNTNWNISKRKQIELVFLREGKKIIELNNIKTDEMGKHFIINCREILYQTTKNNTMNNILSSNDSLQPIIIMELFGYSLIRYIKYYEQNHYRISLKTIRIITIQILSAMSFIHGIGNSIHCDIKSENILINNLESNCENGIYPSIKIIDFGNILSINRQIKTFNIQTIWYRSPEVLFGNANQLSPLIDMWSIGCILFELYTINVGSFYRFFQTRNSNVISKISNELSTFPIYIYNSNNSYNYNQIISENHNTLFHYETNYMKLKANRFYNIMMKLNSNCQIYKQYESENKNEFINFIDLLTCLLDVNPYTRYTSEDAIRHRFIINDEFKENNNDTNNLIKRTHPIIKSSNDCQRQKRINQFIIKFNCNKENNHSKSNTFPQIITKQNLY